MHKSFRIQLKRSQHERRIIPDYFLEVRHCALERPALMSRHHENTLNTTDHIVLLRHLLRE